MCFFFWALALWGVKCNKPFNAHYKLNLTGWHLKCHIPGRCTMNARCAGFDVFKWAQTVFSSCTCSKTLVASESAGWGRGCYDHWLVAQPLNVKESFNCAAFTIFVFHLLTFCMFLCLRKLKHLVVCYVLNTVVAN